MKRKDIFILIICLGISGIIIVFSAKAREGAEAGLRLAEGTIIPSLLPLLTIFFIIMKTSSKDVLSKIFGFVSSRIFNLPMTTFPAIFFGMVGGYPTGALLTNELMANGEIDEKQARRMLRFNFCGGVGFIITAVGTATLSSTRAGVILFFSNVLSSVIVGIALSFSEKRTNYEFYSYTEDISIGEALSHSTSTAVKSVLNITAFIMLFSALNNIIVLPQCFIPIIEITNGICINPSTSLAQTSAYLSFGGLCIHLQILSVLLKAKMKYIDFLLFRIINALLSYVITRIFVYLFPTDIAVFSNGSQQVAELYSVNSALSALMIIGCFVIIFDVSSKKKLV